MTPLTRVQIQDWVAFIRMATTAASTGEGADIWDARINEIRTLALEALDKREEVTTVLKVWRNEFVDGTWSRDHYTEREAEGWCPKNARRVAVPITITETEGH